MYYKNTVKGRSKEMLRERAVGDEELTDGLWGNQVTEQRCKHDEDHGIGNPCEVLKRHISLKLSVYPLID